MMRKNKLGMEFAGVPLKNPVVLASGTCGFGREFREIFDLEKLGGICTKGLTLNARSGNTGTRLWETPSGLMNSIGLENPGVEHFAREQFDWLCGLDLVTIVNVGGHSLEDYCQAVEFLDAYPVDLVELNISCPNVKEGGMNFGVKTEIARGIVRMVRSICHHKLMVKLSPNAEDIVSLARMCEDEGADAVSLVNTFLAMAIDIRNRRPVFDNGYAGLSGPAIKPIALRMVHQVAKNVHIPVMGVGGITCWQDALEFIMAGASAVQVGTASFIRTDLSLSIVQGLERYLEENHLKSLNEIRGIV